VLVAVVAVEQPADGADVAYSRLGHTFFVAVIAMPIVQLLE